MSFTIVNKEPSNRVLKVSDFKGGKTYVYSDESRSTEFVIIGCKPEKLACGQILRGIDTDGTLWFESDDTFDFVEVSVEANIRVI